MFLILFYLINYIVFTLIHLWFIGRTDKALFVLLRSVLLFFVFFLHGDGIQKPFIHSEILPYVKEFEAFYGKKVENTSINFTDFLGSSVVGICLSHSKNSDWYNSKVIKLDRRYWNESSKSSKEILIFHELGHCELNRDHDDDFIKIKSGSKEVFMSKTIMNSYIIDEDKYKENRSYYLIELFSKINTLKH